MSETLIQWLHILSGPLIGAIIGYCTNYIAVKMLFRPHHEVKIGNFHVPFTPGLIPKRQNALAGAVGKAVANSLLTEDDMTKMLESEAIENSVTDLCMTEIKKVMESDAALGETLQNFTGEDIYDKSKNTLKDIIGQRIMNGLMEAKPGEIIAREGTEAVNQMLAGTMFAMFLSPDMLQSMAGNVGVYAENYIRENAPKMIAEQLEKEIAALEGKSVREISEPVMKYEEFLAGKIREIYRSVIGNVTAAIVAQLHIGDVIEEKIKAMDVMELEELVMSVMKHELGMIVNLGALIGFVLGLVNVFL